MNKLAVILLWHMHQPSYVDGLSAELRVPWVRLHAAKGYYDMIAALRRFPTVNPVFNFSGALLQQLELYAQHGLDTPESYLRCSLRPADALGADEAEFVLREFFHANWDTMVRPHPGYARLLQMRGARPAPQALAEALRRFTAQDLLDLQVWFNLAWCGPAACRDLPELAELKAKGMGFCEADKRAVLEAQIELVRRLLDEYKRAAAAGLIELSTSPQYHPILPLLIDTSIGGRCAPDRALPFRQRAPEDALAQIELGLQQHARSMGVRPQGMWPSEGSVCPELIPLLARSGVRWFASDEGVLVRSLDVQAPRPDLLYRPYRVLIEGSEVRALFRDRQLSDLIGFTYAKNEPAAAAADFVERLQRIAAAQNGNNGPACVLAALDGENPWEYYPDGGEEFLEQLYSRIERAPELSAPRAGEFLARADSAPELTRLHSGSWINADFNIWIGHPEENRAWDLLGQARQSLLSRGQHQPSPDPAALERAWDLLYQAEGSDWFWWFGDDFTSPFDQEYDRLFRSKLAGAYAALGLTPPAELNRPIGGQTDQTPLVEPPLDFICPTIDGRVTHFYEWENAGLVRTGQVRGQMHLTRTLLSNLFYGFDLDKLYLRLDPAAALDPHEQIDTELLIQGPREFRARFPLRFDAALTAYEIEPTEGGPARRLELIAGGDVIELAVPFAELGAAVDQQLRLQLRLLRGKIELDCYPRHGSICLVVPDESFRNLMWSC